MRYWSASSVDLCDRAQFGMSPEMVLFLCWLLQVAVMAGTCACSRAGTCACSRGNAEASKPAAKVDTGCPKCGCMTCCGTRIFVLGMVMRTHQFLAIVFGLIPCDLIPRACPRQLSCCVGAFSQLYSRAYVCTAPRRFAGCLSVPVVVLGNLVYWPGYVARDRCRLGVYTVFQFVGLVYWGAVLLFPTAVLLAILRVLVVLLWWLVLLSVIPVLGMGGWLDTGAIVQGLYSTIWFALWALVILWVLVPLNLLTSLVGAILGSIAWCSEPYREGEGPPVVVLGTIASDVDAAAVDATATAAVDAKGAVRNPMYEPVEGED